MNSVVKCEAHSNKTQGPVNLNTLVQVGGLVENVTDFQLSHFEMSVTDPNLVRNIAYITIELNTGHFLRYLPTSYERLGVTYLGVDVNSLTVYRSVILNLLLQDNTTIESVKIWKTCSNGDGVAIDLEQDQLVSYCFIIFHN